MKNRIKCFLVLLAVPIITHCKSANKEKKTSDEIKTNKVYHPSKGRVEILHPELKKIINKEAKIEVLAL